MRQVTILSGKGGTGKTSLAAAFAHLAHDGPCRMQSVLADADVDAANLELVLHPNILEEHEFIGGSVAVIEAERCQGCGICKQVCRFDAVVPPLGIEKARGEFGERNAYIIDSIACEGCAACHYQCPYEAIQMQPQIAGRWFRSECRFGPLVHAELFPAQENSGKLVTLVKQQARLIGLDRGLQLVIVDGPPGIGCPVISAVSGADLALIVTEPTAAGIHDMVRALQTATHFRVPSQVCINKADLYPAGSAEIEDYCHEHDIEVCGHIPFDDAMTEAMMKGEPVTVYRPSAPSSQAILQAWQKIAKTLAK